MWHLKNEDEMAEMIRCSFSWDFTVFDITYGMEFESQIYAQYSTIELSPFLRSFLLNIQILEIVLIWWRKTTNSKNDNFNVSAVTAQLVLNVYSMCAERNWGVYAKSSVYKQLVNKLDDTMSPSLRGKLK